MAKHTYGGSHMLPSGLGVAVKDVPGKPLSEETGDEFRWNTPWAAYSSPTEKMGKRPIPAGSGPGTYANSLYTDPESRWGVSDYYGELGKRWSSDPSRQWIKGGRSYMNKGNAYLGDLATGRISNVDAMERGQVARIGAQAQSMAKSQRGGYNPAAARQANAISANASAMVAPGAAVARQAERSAAADAWLQGAQMARGREQDWWSKQAAWNDAKSKMDQQAHTIGRLDKEMLRRQQMAWYEAQIGASMDQRDLDSQQAARDAQMAGQLIDTAGKLYGYRSRSEGK